MRQEIQFFLIYMSYFVKNYMTQGVPTIEDTASALEAAKTMSKSGKGFLIILKGGRPAGIVTEHDFVNKLIANERNPTETSVGSIMSSTLITVDLDEDLLKASELMQKNNIERLPVVKDGIIYGILTATDIAKGCSIYVDKATRDIVRWLPFGL